MPGRPFLVCLSEMTSRWRFARHKNEELHFVRRIGAIDARGLHELRIAGNEFLKLAIQINHHQPARYAAHASAIDLGINRFPATQETNVATSHEVSQRVFLRAWVFLP